MQGQVTSMEEGQQSGKNNSRVKGLGFLEMG